MKKKYVLKEWVKETICGILLGTILLILSIMLVSNYNDAVNNCIKNGNSKTFCERELSK